MTRIERDDQKIVELAAALGRAAQIAGRTEEGGAALAAAAAWGAGRGWCDDIESVALDGIRSGGAYGARLGRALLAALDAWQVRWDNLIDAPAGFRRVSAVGLACGCHHRTRLAAARCRAPLTYWIGDAVDTATGVVRSWPGIAPSAAVLA